MESKIKLGDGAVSILRNGANLLGSHWAEAALRLAYAAAITRILGAEQFGIWSYALALYTLLIGLVGFGFETQIPLRLGTSRDRLPVIGRTGLVIRLGLLGVAGLVLVLIGLVAEDPGVTRTAILLSLPALLGRGLSLYARWLFVGLETTRIVVRITIAMRFMEVLIGLAFLLSGAGILALIAVHAVAWIAEGLLSLAFLHRKTKALGGNFDRTLAIELLRKGLPLGSAAGLSQWLTTGPILMIRTLFGDLALVGQFALAQQIVVMAVTSIRPFFLAALPVLGRATERGDKTAERFGSFTGTSTVFVFLAGALLAYWLGPPIAAWIFGPEFRLTGQLLAPLMVVGALMLAPLGYMQMLAARSIHWPDVVAGGLGAIALPLAMPWLGSTIGIWGAVLAIYCAWLVRAVVAAGIARRLL